MNRYIDADHLKRWLLARWEEIDPKSENPFKMVDIFNLIDYGELSIDIVRCKECKFWEQYNPNSAVGWCEVFNMYLTPNFFCSYGERRE